jgi:hypothetical protein
VGQQMSQVPIRAHGLGPESAGRHTTMGVSAAGHCTLLGSVRRALFYLVGETMEQSP